VILLRAVDVAAVMKLSIAYSGEMAIREGLISHALTHRNGMNTNAKQILATTSCLSASNERSKSEPACCDFFSKRYVVCMVTGVSSGALTVTVVEVKRVVNIYE
jgi:hypothetical protein